MPGKRISQLPRTGNPARVGDLTAIDRYDTGLTEAVTVGSLNRPPPTRDAAFLGGTIVVSALQVNTWVRSLDTPVFTVDNLSGTTERIVQVDLSAHGTQSAGALAYIGADVKLNGADQNLFNQTSMDRTQYSGGSEIQHRTTRNYVVPAGTQRTFSAQTCIYCTASTTITFQMLFQIAVI